MAFPQQSLTGSRYGYLVVAGAPVADAGGSVAGGVIERRARHGRTPTRVCVISLLIESLSRGNVRLNKGVFVMPIPQPSRHLLPFALAPLVLVGCSTVVRGVVRDKPTGNPLSSATISIGESNATTNAIGAYG